MSEEPVTAGEDAQGETAPAEAAGPASHRGWFVLGLLVQVVFWFLIFFALAVAIGVGGQLTEFRYVGF